jgi:SAM-dependent methyltransferase
MENTRLSLLKKLNKLYPNGKGVEIGVFKGEFSKEILNYWNGTLYMVDVWRGLDEGYEDASNQHGHLNAYMETMKNISGMEDRGIMIRTTSEESSKLFLDESIDFIFLRQTLEHSPYPIFTLMEYNRVLKQGGKIYIEVPAPDTQRKHEWNLNHYSILGEQQLAALLERTGFAINRFDNFVLNSYSFISSFKFTRNNNI